MKQREIKFKVWDNVGYMTSPITMQDLMFGKIQYTSDCTVLQFTGLLDKNGREIYEGDVIKWIHKHGDFEPTEQVSTVEYQKYSDGWIGYEVFNDAEIIGNLYENPELLK